MKSAFYSLFLVLICGCTIPQWLKQPDNPVEEVAEGVIKYETDIDIDLTPGTPEKK